MKSGVPDSWGLPVERATEATIRVRDPGSSRWRPDSAESPGALIDPASAEGRLRVHLVQLAGFHVVNEAADPVLVRHERAGLDARDRLAHVTLEVGERLERKRWPDAHLGLDLRLHVVVLEGQHPAVGV